MMEALPVVGGIAGLVVDTKDPKSQIFWILGACLILIVAGETLGYSIGPIAQQVSAMAIAVMSFMIGQKDAEIKFQKDE